MSRAPVRRRRKRAAMPPPDQGSRAYVSPRAAPQPTRYKAFTIERQRKLRQPDGRPLARVIPAVTTHAGGDPIQPGPANAAQHAAKRWCSHAKLRSIIMSRGNTTLTPSIDRYGVWRTVRSRGGQNIRTTRITEQNRSPHHTPHRSLLIGIISSVSVTQKCHAILRSKRPAPTDIRLPRRIIVPSSA
jgi:hypothetical protein